MFYKFYFFYHSIGYFFMISRQEKIVKMSLLRKPGFFTETLINAQVFPPTLVRVDLCSGSVWACTANTSLTYPSSLRQITSSGVRSFVTVANPQYHSTQLYPEKRSISFSTTQTRQPFCQSNMLPAQQRQL